MTSTNQDLLNLVASDESVAYAISSEEGFIRKRKTKQFMITSYRLLVIDFKHPENSYALPLEEIDDVVVFDQQRVSASGYQMAGTRSSFSYYAGTSKGRSKNIGSLYFISHKLEDVFLKEVNDP